VAVHENVFHEAFLSVGVNTRRPIRIGVEQSTIVHHGRPYLARWIAYLAGTIRLHRFLRGDDDRAPHDHPWWFITFPFTSYVEKYWARVEEERGGVHWTTCTRIVKAWRFHFRPAEFRHYVIGRADGKDKPFWTLCITGYSSSKRKWGFWPDPTKFVYWRDWT